MTGVSRAMWLLRLPVPLHSCLFHRDLPERVAVPLIPLEQALLSVPCPPSRDRVPVLRLRHGPRLIPPLQLHARGYLRPSPWLRLIGLARPSPMHPAWTDSWIAIFEPSPGVRLHPHLPPLLPWCPVQSGPGPIAGHLPAARNHLLYLPTLSCSSRGYGTCFAGSIPALIPPLVLDWR